ncbi:MAG: 2-C-methyl-D-erythritol 2,4-cyclodiphosphate synthase [Candidatus Dormibacteria bacterium]
MSGFRVGQGYDIHRLVMGRPLVLGGVTLPWDMGLAGHSDGDAICHAVTDAVLGAAALGDIGSLFPDDDPHWQGADSLELLRLAVERAAERGFHVVNTDVTVILEVPRLKAYREAIVANLARVLRVDVASVGVKAKTNERLGEIGRGEAIAAIAVVLLGGPG